MKKALTKSTVILVSGLMAAAAWAAESPIGSLTINGKATITAQESSFTLQDQEYAYFSSDRVETDEGSQALVAMTDGLQVAIAGSSAIRIIQDNGAYAIELEKGSMAVDALEGVDYRLTRNGEAIPVSEEYLASGERYLVSVLPESDEARVYMPAQMEQEGERRGLLWFLAGAGTGAAIYFANNDDNGGVAPPPPGNGGTPTPPPPASGGGGGGGGGGDDAPPSS